MLSNLISMLLFRDKNDFTSSALLWMFIIITAQKIILTFFN